MKVVQYPVPADGDAENIVGWVSSEKVMVGIKIGEKVELEDAVAAELCAVYKFLISYNEEEFAKAFPYEQKRKERKLEKAMEAEKEAKKQEVKEVVEEVEKEKKSEKEVEQVEGVYVCEVCEKECKSKAGLLAHMRSHEDEELE